MKVTKLNLKMLLEEEGGSYPVIVLDMWEHAYYKDYLNDKKKYIFAMMKQLNWKVIDERFQRAEDVGEVFK